MTLDVLAVSPHPDDVELGCGGTLTTLTDKGYKVGIADLTDALLSTRGDERTRTDEAEKAASIMGISKRYRLGFSEGAIQSDSQNVSKMVSLIRRTCPHVIFGPWESDRHPDHADSSRLVQTASFWAGVGKYGDNQPPHRPHRIIYYFLHWVGPVSFVAPISSAFDRKLKAVRAYSSQFFALPGEKPLTYISRPEFIEKMISRARYFGSQIGEEYGEAFYVREMNRVADPVEWVNEQGIVG